MEHILIFSFRSAASMSSTFVLMSAMLFSDCSVRKMTCIPPNAVCSQKYAQSMSHNSESMPADDANGSNWNHHTEIPNHTLRSQSLPRNQTQTPCVQLCLSRVHCDDCLTLAPTAKQMLPAPSVSVILTPAQGTCEQPFTYCRMRVRFCLALILGHVIFLLSITNDLTETRSRQSSASSRSKCGCIIFSIHSCWCLRPPDEKLSPWTMTLIPRCRHLNKHVLATPHVNSGSCRTLARMNLLKSLQHNRVPYSDTLSRPIPWSPRSPRLVLQLYVCLFFAEMRTADVCVHNHDCCYVITRLISKPRN